MRRLARSTVVVAAFLVPMACGGNGGQGGEHGASGARSVPLYDNLGNHHHDITTSNPLAQQYFDQGLRLLYAFNHAEAIQSFAEAERLDPSCAMCAWGIALASGPNINAPMEPEGARVAFAAITRAVDRAANASARERALIQALATRYAPEPADDRAALDSAYALAMAAVADKHLDDLDAQVLHADAVMNLSPWNYWSDGRPRPGAKELLSRLEDALGRNRDHPGACHLYIHALEAHEPERAVPCAERLASLMPGAGHVVHMPAHIYIRVGRYADAIETNEHAVHADESYLEGSPVSHEGIYPQGYYPHNYHFLSFAASMAGNKARALSAARKVAERVGPEVAREIGWLEAVTPVVYWTLVTFGAWDEILAEPLPPTDLRFTTGMAYYARGAAFAAKESWEDAARALDSVSTIAAAFPEGDNRTALQVAREALAGEVALRRADHTAAVRHFRQAVQLEDGLTYNEPPTWYYPMRQSLGKALLAAGRAAEAERVYLEDLSRFPENGWSLLGLSQALARQGRSAEAREARERFESAWRLADVTLPASRI